MSTIVYAGKQKSDRQSGLPWYVEALAALVPVEVLTAHAFMIAVTTTTADNVTTITDPDTLVWTFAVLTGMSMALYVVRSLIRKWQHLDFVRMFIPPFAFAAWTMIQKTTAFDAVWPMAQKDSAKRYLVGIVVAIVAIAAAGALAYGAEKKQGASAGGGGKKK